MQTAGPEGKWLSSVLSEIYSVKALESSLPLEVTLVYPTFPLQYHIDPLCLMSLLLQSLCHYHSRKSWHERSNDKGLQTVNIGSTFIDWGNNHNGIMLLVYLIAIIKEKEGCGKWKDRTDNRERQRKKMTTKNTRTKYKVGTNNITTIPTTPLCTCNQKYFNYCALLRTDWQLSLMEMNYLAYWTGGAVQNGQDSNDVAGLVLR